MKDLREFYPGRECREFWTVHGHRAVHVQGFDCGPSNTEYWWCPEIGLSISQEHHTYPNEVAAWRAAVAELEKEIADAQRQLAIVRVSLVLAEHPTIPDPL